MTRSLRTVAWAAAVAGAGALGRRRGRRSVAAHACAREQQVIPFIDPATGSEVVLLACMHFNPQSVKKTTTVTKQAAEDGSLGAVVVESCPTRWGRVLEVQPPGSFLRGVLDNEMQAAAEVAEASGRAVVLGDQRVEDLGAEIGSLAQNSNNNNNS